MCSFRVQLTYTGVFGKKHTNRFVQYVLKIVFKIEKSRSERFLDQNTQCFLKTFDFSIIRALF